MKHKLKILLLTSTIGLSGLFTNSIQDVKAAEVVSAKAFFPGEYSTTSTEFGISTKNELFAWGSNKYGQLGNNETDTVSPQMVKPLGISNVKKVFGTSLQTLALTNEGDIYTWGYKGSLLGTGDSLTHLVPTKINISNVKDLIVGEGRGAYAITNDGDVYSWGDTNGRTGSSTTPEKIPTLSNIESIVTNNTEGSLRVFAVTTDGRVYAWGNNENSTLGIKTSVNQEFPVVVPNLSNIKKVNAGETSTYAIDKDGNVYSWGKYAGHPGGVYDINSEPKKLDGLSNIKEIEKGKFAISETGDVYTWGVINPSAITGLGQTAVSQTPIKIEGLSNIEKIKMNVPSTAIFALDKEGSVFSWGRNTNGELGLGYKISASTYQYTPKKIDGLPLVKSLPTNDIYRTVFVVTREGEGWAWGTGYLGNGTNSNTNLPVKMEMFEAVPEPVPEPEPEPDPEPEPEPGTPSSPEDVDKDVGFEIGGEGLHLSVNMTNLNPTLTQEAIIKENFSSQIADIQNLIVKDFTGTSAGWSVYMKSTQMKEVAPTGGFKEGTSAITLPTGTLSLESTLSSTTSFNVNPVLSALDKGTPQKFIWANAGKGMGENSLPDDGDIKIKVKNLSSVPKLVDTINYPTTATAYKATINFSLVQGEL